MATSNQSAKTAKPGAGSSRLPPCGFSVSGGKKGNLPVSVEKRPKGKKVTIISNVQGSAKSLLSALSSLLGCGGTSRQEASGQHWTVEIQGDQVDRVAAALTQLGCLRGVKKEVTAENKKKTVEVATRVCAYDKFLRRGEVDRNETPSGAADMMEFADSLIGAECTKWHGPWIYCRGRCEKVDFSDVWHEAFEGPQERSPPPNAVTVSQQSSVTDLNEVLRGLGMLSEVGEASRAWSKTPKNPVSFGLTLTEYRRVALAPGARIIGEDPAAPSSSSTCGGSSKTRSSSAHAAKSVSNQSSTRGPPRRERPLPKEGHFPCERCGCVFGLKRTLMLHFKRAHPGADMRPSTAPVASAAQLPAQSVKKVPGWSSRTAAWPSRAKKSCNTPEPEPQHSVTRGDPEQSQYMGDEEFNRITDEMVAESSWLSPCPVCGEEFAQDLIEAHVDTCLEKVAIVATGGKKNNAGVSRHGNEYSHGDDREHPGEPQEDYHFCQVVQDYAPTGLGNEVQLRVQRGDDVLVLWRQPPDEGGFWAYVLLASSPDCRGYMPMSHLRPVETPAGTNDEMQRAPETQSNSEILQGSIPEEWLESFLILNLSEEYAAEFWHTFESRMKDMPMSAAWLSTMRDVCEKPSKVANISAQPAFAEVSTPQATVKPSTDTGRCPQTASGTGTGSSSSSTSLSPAVQHTVETKLVHTSKASSSTAPSPSREIGNAGEAPVPAISKIDVWEVVQEWIPQGLGDDIQLQARQGELFVLDWVQPPEEGGFWAYGHIQGRPEIPGYLPIDHLASTCTPTRTPESAPATTRRPWRRHRDRALNENAEGQLPGHQSVELLPAKMASPDAEQDEEMQAWATGQLSSLCRRFCQSYLDAGTAYAVLLSCNSSDELRSEAVSLIADNQPVKNFAAELWRRRALAQSLNGQCAAGAA